MVCVAHNCHRTNKSLMSPPPLRLSVVPFCMFSRAAILPFANCERQKSSHNHIGIFHCSWENHDEIYTHYIAAGLLRERFALLFALIAGRNFITCIKCERCSASRLFFGERKKGGIDLHESRENSRRKGVKIMSNVFYYEYIITRTAS